MHFSLRLFKWKQIVWEYFRLWRAEECSAHTVCSLCREENIEIFLLIRPLCVAGRFHENANWMCRLWALYCHFWRLLIRRRDLVLITIFLHAHQTRTWIQSTMKFEAEQDDIFWLLFKNCSSSEHKLVVYENDSKQNPNKKVCALGARSSLALMMAIIIAHAFQDCFVTNVIDNLIITDWRSHICTEIVETRGKLVRKIISCQQAHLKMMWSDRPKK